MNQSLALYLLMAFSVVAANVPFLSERLFAVLPYRRAGQAAVKPFWLRAVEMLVLYGVAVGLGFAFEARLGNRFAQAWEFYAITLSVFVVLGYPAYVWRYLLHRRGRRASAQTAA